MVHGETLNPQGVRDKVNFMIGDSRRLDRVLPADWKLDKVVSNLPFGIRSGRLKTLPKIYMDLLRSLKPFLKENSKICLLSVHKNLIDNLCDKLNYIVLGSKRILYGGLQTWIMLLKPSF